MSKHLAGEFISLMDGDEDVVHGHVSAEVYNEAVRVMTGDNPNVTDAQLRRVYARWIPVKDAPYDIEFRYCRGPARGAFPVTAPA